MANSDPAVANPARPAAGVRLCRLDEIPDPGAKSFRFKADGALFAGFVLRKGPLLAGYVDSCPHAGWPLAGMDERFLTRDAAHILCAGHGALFRPDDGLCVAGPCAGRFLAPWPVTEHGGEVVTA